MTKKIEEAAKEFVANYYELEEYGDEVSDIEIDNSEECFIAGAEHVLSLPLSQRLTDEERERIKANYADAKDIHARCVGTMCKNHIADLHNEYNKGLNMGIIIALKHIFGKELFGEGI